MKRIKLISIVTVTALLIFSTALILNKPQERFEYHGYSFQYDPSLYKFIQSGSIKTKDYFSNMGDITYQSGFFYFSVNEDTIAYSLRDRELPPSNALNDIYPIKKKKADLQIKFDTDEEKYGFMYIICTKDEVVEKFMCVPGTDKLITNYNYGQIPTSEYYFEKTLDVMGMKWSRLSFSFNDGRTPTQSDINNLISFHYLVATAKRLN